MTRSKEGLKLVVGKWRSDGIEPRLEHKQGPHVRTLATRVIMYVCTYLP